MTLSAKIAGLFVYPVKSCRGIALSSAELTERGLAHDREWMIVDAAGRFVSQRELPRLAMIGTALPDGGLALSAPDRAPLTLPLGPSGARRPVTVWRDTVQAIDEGEGAARWLSDWCERELRLVRFDPDVRRTCNRAYVGDSGAHTGFADAYPLLVLAEASLADLNTRLSSPLPMNRFRPNVVLSGTEAYDEDHIDEIAAGAIRLKLVKPCTRCQITTTDQATAEQGSEPLVTLATYRMSRVLDGVTFGVNAIVSAGAGETLHVGATAECSLRF
jgi:uncharacterized protein YcbX